jgi:hypothetical protein
MEAINKTGSAIGVLTTYVRILFWLMIFIFNKTKNKGMILATEK